MGKLYIGKESKFITKLFKDFNIGIAFHTRNTIESLLSKHNQRYSKYNQCGVYELKCKNCSNIYTGQTGRSFKTRFKEHIQDIWNNRNKTGYSHHIINTGHAYDNIENTLNILNTQKKGPFLNTLEKFHIYKAKKNPVIYLMKTAPTSTTLHLNYCCDINNEPLQARPIP
jgi:hypothetical protein